MAMWCFVVVVGVVVVVAGAFPKRVFEFVCEENMSFLFQ